ncbi:hypothetical protein RFI_10235 [Reticulomyxa filosa]|uniref:Gamma-glutamylcyclotransferase AIG2-like domain-containing protein n=1 Tax=Reticulomyxa filosa TaxID=46433 RepID=X6NKV5_RETFI|nr:hypothetical protein RFI_10235 [Reticulomyxa filosa]|eukprot:ETO26900.1 hypothetical protein RFI_10235 [Reticulomyxa filosa]
MFTGSDHSYPFALRSGNAKDKIFGRLVWWENDKDNSIFTKKLKQADEIEGIDQGFYARDAIDVHVDETSTIKAFIYFKLAEKCDLSNCESITSGDWLKRNTINTIKNTTSHESLFLSVRGCGNESTGINFLSTFFVQNIPEEKLPLLACSNVQILLHKIINNLFQNYF